MTTSRRSFAAGLLVLPRRVVGGSGLPAPSDRLHIAGVGVGGMGASYLRGCETENIAALCDVDDAVAARTFARYPEARRHRDYRILLEKEKGIDAVVIGTPDHTHARIALAAIDAGKHVYCAKPLTRTIGEVRRLARAAAGRKVATQMSVQSSASDAAQCTAEWVRAGAVGTVREVHVWTDRPVWPQGLGRPAETPPVPPGLDWDLWLGPAPRRPYHPVYHPFNWRGWYDFGTGALGDMACHAFHVVFRAVDLGRPAAVHASSTFLMQPAVKDPDQPWMRARKASFPETFPVASIVTWDFPARGGRPAVRMHWYDGGLMPPRPADLEPARKMPTSGLLFEGDKGALLSGFTGGPLWASSPSFAPPPKTLPRSAGHYQEWIAAAKGGPPATCEFGFGSLLTEVALLGTVAIRTGRRLAWDAESGRFDDAEAQALVEQPERSGW